MSSHTLAILETGRHAKPKIATEERKCRYCNLDDVEDEKHFLLKCPLYNKECLSLFFFFFFFLLNFYPGRSVVLNVSAMSQGDFFQSSKEPTTVHVKALGTFLHNGFMKKGEGDEPLPVQMYKSQCSAVFCCYDN